MELYKKHRPTMLKHIVGQEHAIKVIQSKIKAKNYPHSSLFHGPSGCGKTTLGRIIAGKLGCVGWDFIELNCADDKGIDVVRNIRTQVGLLPMHGSCRVWLIDEVQEMTKAAQSAFLKILEDTPEHAYFMLATTDPEKLLRTIRTRCMSIELKTIAANHITKLLQSVLTLEKVEIGEEVLDKIVECSAGSARMALVYLDSVIQLDDDEERLRSITMPETNKIAFDLVKAMLWTKSKWPEVCKLLRGIKEEPERIRHLILACANTEILKGGANAARAYLVITVFRDHWYDCKEAGLAASCYEVINTK